MRVRDSSWLRLFPLRMKRSANVAANAVNMPMMLKRNRLSVMGVISAVIPTMMVASTTTTPKMSPSASDACFFLMLCKEKVSSGSVVPSAVKTRPMRMVETPRPSASECALQTMACAARSMQVRLMMSARVFLNS